MKSGQRLYELLVSPIKNARSSNFKREQSSAHASSSLFCCCFCRPIYELYVITFESRALALPLGLALGLGLLGLFYM